MCGGKIDGWAWGGASGAGLLRAGTGIECERGGTGGRAISKGDGDGACGSDVMYVASYDTCTCAKNDRSSGGGFVTSVSPSK